LTYREVDEIIEKKDDKEVLTSTLQTANILKEKIKNYRESKGVLNFDFPETKIILDKENNPI
jgi:ribonuclease R